MAEPGFLKSIAAALAENGLVLRGGFDFAKDEDAPAGIRSEPAKSVLLVGQRGAGNWNHFNKWLQKFKNKPENPLDTWSREVICVVAADCSARAVFPSDKPWLPFQQWASRAEGLRPSPLGILIHPEFGLWHAYRGALLFDDVIGLPQPPKSSHPCDDCEDKPCLITCPVSAISLNGYDVAGCAGHVSTADDGHCRNTGCLARNSCPVGANYRYPAEVQAFHMAAFLANNTPN
ncbi:MAG: hypothetical protein AB3N20_02075 [Rhizobiaceae bacterium]